MMFIMLIAHKWIHTSHAGKRWTNCLTMLNSFLHFKDLVVCNPESTTFGNLQDKQAKLLQLLIYTYIYNHI